jgi:hypothetical protein
VLAEASYKRPVRPDFERLGTCPFENAGPSVLADSTQPARKPVCINYSRRLRNERSFGVSRAKRFEEVTRWNQSWKA